MKKVLFFAVVLCLVATTAMAGDMTKRLGLGFVTTDAPVGGRYWFTDKVGFDLGFGFSNTNLGKSNVPTGVDNSATDFTIAVGLPINVMSVDDRVNFHVTPMFEYQSLKSLKLAAEVNNGAPLTGMSTPTSIAGLLVLEFEVNVTQDFTVSASHGLGFMSVDSGVSGADKLTEFTTLGKNVTEFGFHYYLPGGE